MQYKLGDLIREWDVSEIMEVTEEEDRIKIYCKFNLGTDKQSWPKMLYLTK